MEKGCSLPHPPLPIRCAIGTGSLLQERELAEGSIEIMIPIETKIASLKK
jgi:hypothetical protein